MFLYAFLNENTCILTVFNLEGDDFPLTENCRNLYENGEQDLTSLHTLDSKKLMSGKYIFKEFSVFKR